jgi:hypothetical protein
MKRYISIFLEMCAVPRMTVSCSYKLSVYRASHLHAFEIIVINYQLQQ